jgi:hypothetical protein
MNKYLIGTLVVIVALVLGVTAAFGLSRMTNTAASNGFSINQSITGRPGPGMMGGSGMIGGNGMMGESGFNAQQSTGNRISLDEAVQKVQAYAASAGLNFQAAEIMEFSNNFYAAVVEKDTGKAAFEVLVDPYTGAVFPEFGPNMMWNVKYGQMGTGRSQENTLTFDQARVDAQTALDRQVPGARVEPDGSTFYGYYTFDYKLNGQIAGMLSVNGMNGQAWLHTWHGQFIAEKDLTK